MKSKPKTLGQIAYEAFDAMLKWGPWSEATSDTHRRYNKMARAVEREVLKRLKRWNRNPHRKRA